jgi:acyl carrier protein
VTRAEILSYVRAHLADELEIDAARVEEQTRFKEDLEADSLDLYSLVQELEDTYGVRMSDEQAARIRTVGQAVDFVITETSTNSPGGESSADGEASGRGGTSSPGDDTSDPGASAGEDAATGTTANREPRP